MIILIIYYFRLYCLLSRYETFFKNNGLTNEGYGMQAALPSKVFSKLSQIFNIKQEMFASPFNCYFNSYCSAFYDTDYYFGSMGSFFNFEPNENGFFQCNPPFTEQVIERLADRLQYLLENSNNNNKFALSFIVFIPEWLNPPTPGLVKLKQSKYKRFEFNLNDNQHEYISGSQYLSKINEQLYLASHNTCVFILQNESGNLMFNITQDNINDFKLSTNIYINNNNNLEIFKRIKTKK
jgi:phosphorylated CTD-interacting factor 1